MGFDMELLRDCCKDEAAVSRLLEYVETQHGTLSHADLIRVFHFSPDPIVVTRLSDGQVLAMNNSCTELMGYTEVDFSISNPQLWDDRSMRDEMVAKLKQDGKLQNFKAHFRHKDGHSIYTLLSGEVIHYQGEDAFLAMGHDITAYVATEEKLRKSEEQYRRVVQHQTEVICVYDAEMRFTFANEAYCNYFGYALDDIIGKKLLEIVPPEIHQSIREHIATLLATKQPIVYEREAQAANGEWCWLQWSDIPIVDGVGNVIEIQAVGRDITAHKRSETNLRLLLNNLPRTAIVVFDTNLNFTAIEGNIVDLIGFTAEALLGKTPAAMFSGEHQFHTDEVMRHVLDGQELEFEYEFMERILRIQVYPIWQGGTVIAGFGILEDITERKATTQTIMDLTLERNRVQLITDFVTSTQHEFRTPLSIIESSLYLAENSPNPEKRTQAFQKVRNQVVAIDRLVEELVMMARLDARADSDNHQPMNVNYAISFALAEVDNQAREKNITIDKQLAGDALMVSANQSQLVHALVQLLDNAVRYTQQGGKVTIASSMQKDIVNIAITDTGAGISLQEMRHIFERFYRVDKAHSTPGFGLGLPIAEKIIELHEGTLTATSTVGIGSTFTIQLPYHSKP
jgi:PAS domain S-box-containing protein